MSNQRQQPLGGSIRNPDVQAVSDPKTLGPATEQTQQFRSPTQSQQVPETQLRQSASQQPVQRQPVQRQPVQQQPVQQQPVQQQTSQHPIQQQPVQQQPVQQPTSGQLIQQQPARQQAVPLQSQQYAGALQPRQMTGQSVQVIPGQSVGTQTTARVQTAEPVPQPVQQTELAAVPQLVDQPIQQLPRQKFGQPIQQLPQQAFGQPIQQRLQQPRQQSAVQRQPLFAGQYDQALGEKPVGNARQYTTLSGPAAGSNGQFLLAGAQPKSTQVSAQQPVQAVAQQPAQVARSQLAQTTKSRPATTQQPPAEAFSGGFRQSIPAEAIQRPDFDPSLGRTDVTEFGGVSSNVASGVQSSQQPAGSKAPATRSGMVAGSSLSGGNEPAVANTAETTEPGAM